ncbi:hypothetical protein OAF54_03400 [bacterium]|nr:hypothetical protein [bacterium]
MKVILDEPRDIADEIRYHAKDTQGCVMNPECANGAVETGQQLYTLAGRIDIITRQMVELEKPSDKI